jgi:hypothetical protein
MYFHHFHHFPSFSILHSATFDSWSLASCHIGSSRCSEAIMGFWVPTGLHSCESCIIMDQCGRTKAPQVLWSKDETTHTEHPTSWSILLSPTNEKFLRVKHKQPQYGSLKCRVLEVWNWPEAAVVCWPLWSAGDLGHWAVVQGIPHFFHWSISYHLLGSLRNPLLVDLVGCHTSQIFRLSHFWLVTFQFCFVFHQQEQIDSRQIDKYLERAVFLRMVLSYLQNPS